MIPITTVRGPLDKMKNNSTLMCTVIVFFISFNLKCNIPYSEKVDFILAYAARPYLTPRAPINQHSRGPLGDATYQISRLYALWFQTRDLFHVFPTKAYVKYVTTGRVHFGPRDIF